MDFKDLFITPIYLLLLTLLAYWVRPYLTSKQTRKYFLPALWIRFVGAIALGMIYQFYYKGGDTFYYFYHSGIMWEALLNDPLVGLKILFTDVSNDGKAYMYVSRMFWYNDPPSLFVGKFGSVFDLITFHTYSATTLFFAIFSFSGSWAFFQVLLKKYPHDIKNIALVILFFPSLVFWGSGFLKDSLTLGGILWIVYCFFKWIELKQFSYRDILIFAIAFYMTLTIKIYIIVCLVPAIFIWIGSSKIGKIKNQLIRFVLAPVVLLLFLLAGFFSTKQLVSEESKYSFDRIARTAAIASHDIGHVTGRDAGSGYSFGRLDGTFGGLMIHAHKSILVSLFRPFIWEVNNPFMLLASLESLVMLLIFINALRKRKLRKTLKDPFLLSSFLFAIIFAFAVGFSYNFGTLMRYRIPLLAFFLIPLLIRVPATPFKNGISPSEG